MTTAESMVGIEKEGNMMTWALKRMGRCRMCTKPVMWNRGRTARTRSSFGVILSIWRHCAMTFWWDIMTFVFKSVSDSLEIVVLPVCKRACERV